MSDPNEQRLVYIKNDFEIWVHRVDADQVYFARYKSGSEDRDGKLMRTTPEIFREQTKDAEVLTRKQAFERAANQLKTT